MATHWHYTIDCSARLIFQSGIILPATAGIRDTERPITWFSVNPTWENTVRKLWPDGTLLDFQGYHARGIGLVRIGVAPETAPLRWKELRDLGGYTKKDAAILAKAAESWYANPLDWRGTFDAVPREKWLAIESYDTGRRVWVSSSEDSLLA